MQTWKSLKRNNTYTINETSCSYFEMENSKLSNEIVLHASYPIVFRSVVIEILQHLQFKIKVIYFSLLYEVIFFRVTWTFLIIDLNLTGTIYRKVAFMEREKWRVLLDATYLNSVKYKLCKMFLEVISSFFLYVLWKFNVR